MPYVLPLTVEDVYENNFCCAGKSQRLEMLFKRSGFDVRQRLCTFKWNESLVPVDVLEKLLEGVQMHQYAEIFIPENDSWVVIDSTWDKKLSATGFAISEWDGLTSTVINVDYDEILDLAETESLLKQYATDKAATKRFLDNNQVFLAAFNGWLESMRKQA